MFLHRPGMIGMSEDLSEAEVIIAKNRSGQVGSIEMRYNGDLVRFEDANKPYFYESAMNQPQPQAQPQTPPPPPPAYNPFDEFSSSQTEFV